MTQIVSNSLDHRKEALDASPVLSRLWKDAPFIFSELFSVDLFISRKQRVPGRYRRYYIWLNFKLFHEPTQIAGSLGKIRL
jgi:hypothetical protein